MHDRVAEATPRPVKRPSFGVRPSRIAACYALIIVLAFGIGDTSKVVTSRNRPPDYRVGGAGGSVGNDGRGDRADAGGGSSFGHDLATAGLSVALAAA